MGALCGNRAVRDYMDCGFGGKASGNGNRNFFKHERLKQFFGCSHKGMVGSVPDLLGHYLK